MKFKEYKKIVEATRNKHKKEKTQKEYYENQIVQYVAWAREEPPHLKYLYLSPSILPILILVSLGYFSYINLEFLKALILFFTIGSLISWIFNYIFKDFLRLWLIELPWWFIIPLKFYYLFLPMLLVVVTYYLLWKYFLLFR